MQPFQLVGLKSQVFGQLRHYRGNVERPGFRQQLMLVGSETVILSRRGDRVELSGPVVINHSPLAGISVI